MMSDGPVNERKKRMKTSVNEDQLSLPPVQAAGLDVKIGSERGGGAEKPGFGVEKWLAIPRDGRIIPKMTGSPSLAP